MAPTTQKALLVTTLGKPVTYVDNHPVPQPGPNQVLLRVKVAGINPHDEKARNFGLFIAERLPAVLTNDVVGTVTALGADVTKYKIGDRVLSHAGFADDHQTGLQEYATCDVEAGFKIPDGVSDDEAATLPTNIIAPLVGMFDDKNGLGIPAPWTEEAKGFAYKSTTLLIIGGGSNCGRFAVQLARLASVGRIVVVGGNEEELKGFGATDVLDRHGGMDAVLERIHKVVDDELVYAFDAVNAPPGQVVGLNAMSSSKRGRLARLVPLGPVDTSKVEGKKAGFDVVDVLGLSEMKPQLAYPFWARMPEYLTSGQIRPLGFVVREGLTAANVNEVFDGYRDGGNVNKTHIHL